MVEIKKQLISINYSKGVNINPEYIVIHETDNPKKGANAEANRNYFANHPEAQASAHFVVDNNVIVQCLELNQRAWHVGVVYGQPNVPQANNSNTIGIEICVNEDGDYNKAVNNAIDLTKYLMNQLNIPAERVIRHYDVCVKQCPSTMIKNPSLWQDFKSKLINKPIPVIKYQAHVQNIGWQDWKENGQVAGTEGQSLRLEALAINCSENENIVIQGHIQNKGWQSIRTDGEIVGTVGQDLRLEAIKINLESTEYSVEYQVHVQDIGWQNWVKDGAIAGTTGESKRIEAIKIRIVNK